MSIGYQEALKAYHAALQANPACIITHYQLGLFFLKQGEYAYAKIQFNNVLALDDAHIDALFHLGVSLIYLGEDSEAEGCFQRILKENPSYVEAWVNLGALALKRDEGQLAIAQFTQALVLDLNHEAARSNLAATFMHHHRYENAMTHYEALLLVAPDNPEYLYNMAVAEMAMGLLTSARDRFLNLLHIAPTDFTVLYNLGVVYLRLKHKAQAQDYLSRALAIQPDDVNCQHVLAALTGGVSSPTVTTQYTTQLFDGYALYYDKHVCDELEYRLPAYLAAVCQELEITQVAQTLDLGCGTGLCGGFLREISQILTGVDLSSNMIKQAREKRCYDSLIQQEAVAFLREKVFAYDLIVVADVLPYLGELKAVFEAVKTRLAAGGYFMFTVEISESMPWHLQSTGRFAHHPAYIQALCDESGFKVVMDETKIARQQDGEALDVRVFVCRG